MKKTAFAIISVVTVSLICICLSVAAFASPAYSASRPYWYPDYPHDFENFHGEDLPYVVDDAAILSESEKNTLSQLAKRITELSGYGYVIFTDHSSYGISLEEYSADFLYFNGYGMGDNYSAVVFFLCLEPGNRGWRTTSVGDCEALFDGRITYYIDETVDADMRAGNYYDALYKQADFILGYYEKLASGEEYPDIGEEDPYYDDPYYDHRFDDPYYNAPQRGSDSLISPLSVIFGAVIGLIVAAVVTSGMKKGMTLSKARSAASYLVPGSFRLNSRDVIFLYSSVTKTRRERQNNRSSGSSHGGSFHSSGHSSGGGHFSSGGRNF